MQIGYVGSIDVAVATKVVKKQSGLAPCAKNASKMRIDDDLGFAAHCVAVSFENFDLRPQRLHSLSLADQGLNVQQNTCLEKGVTNVNEKLEDEYKTNVCIKNNEYQEAGGILASRSFLFPL